MPSRKYIIDAAERLGWTIAYAVLSFLIADAAHWSYTWTPVLIMALNAAKVTVARFIGNPETAKFDSKEIQA